MKKAILISLLVGIVLLSFASAASNTACNIGVSIINQDPYPAIPGSYVNVVFQVTGVENPNCVGTWFELVPNYPFSLDENATNRQSLAGGVFTPNYNNNWVIPYKVRVDDGAISGYYNLDVAYSASGSDGSYVQIPFNISVQDSRTNFDSVIQQVSGSIVSIAIANTGKYDANSVIVKIPNQAYFTTVGTNGQIVGNLASGDYSLVSFDISPKMSRNQTGSRTNFTGFSGQQNNLDFSIDYTDALGFRQEVNMSLPLLIASGNSTGIGNFSRTRTTTGSSIFSKWYFWIVVIIIILILYGVYGQRIKERIKKRDKSGVIPDWIKNVKAKEKR